jgi:hypothetical protein
VFNAIENNNFSLHPRWWLHLIVVRSFEYASDPESYTSGSEPTGRASLAEKIKW